MNPIDALFQKKSNDILSIYFTAGFPEKASTGAILKSLQAAGADLVELGFPFSDPLADGPVIQSSSQRAIENGMSLGVLLDQLQAMKEAIQIPVILMGYLNSIHRMGVETFCQRAQAAGAAGMIIPDMPPEAYVADYQQAFEAHGLYPIFLVSPQTPDERVRYVASLSKGFLYLISQAGTTGLTSDFEQSAQFFQRIKKMQLNIPLLAGFGIRDAQGFARVNEYLNGGIIGSAFIQALQAADNPALAAEEFVQGIRGE